MERDESKFSIVYYLGASSPDPAQQDAIFYTGFGCVAKVLYEGFAVDIYCDGETKANLLDAPKGKVVSTLYTKNWLSCEKRYSIFHQISTQLIVVIHLQQR